MPGLEMPIRGGGAAMLRELRDEERPSPDNQDVVPEAEPGKQSISKTDQSYDNMTNNLADNQSEQKEGVKASNTARKKASQSLSQSVVRQTSKQGGQNANQSVADMIRRRAAQREGQEVLKTVTLKLSPALDERVEQYCFDNRMKKQEFWAEAAALYFEMIVQAEES